MTRAFWRSVVWVMCMAAGLLSLGPAARLVPPSPAFLLARKFRVLVRLLHLQKWPGPAANYYEQLVDDFPAYPASFLVSRLQAKLMTPEELAALIWQGRQDYLSWGFQPNLRIETPEGLFITNSYGMADREYPLSKAPGTRRIAILGDSTTRGLGVPPESTYRALLEKRLNESSVPNGGPHYEILNFAIDAYAFTQFPAVIERARAFHPDVYLVALTDLDTGPGWSYHLAQLETRGFNFKYLFLRDLMQRSGVNARQSESQVREKLAPYFVSTFRWALTEMQASAARAGAQLLVILIPDVADDQAAMEANFSVVRSVVGELHIPCVDALDSFAGLAGIDVLRVGGYDMHPNVQGHGMICHDLYRKIAADPALWTLVTGGAAGSGKSKNGN